MKIVASLEYHPTTIQAMYIVVVLLLKFCNPAALDGNCLKFSQASICANGNNVTTASNDEAKLFEAAYQKLSSFTEWIRVSTANLNPKKHGMEECQKAKAS